MAHKTNICTLTQHRSNGQRFTEGPVDLAAFDHAHALSKLALKFWVNRKAFGRTDGDGGDLEQRRTLNAGLGGAHVEGRFVDRHGVKVRHRNGAYFVEHTL